MGEYGTTPKETREWKMPEDRPKSKISRRAFLAGLASMGGAKIGERFLGSAKNPQEAKTETEKPSLSVESMAREFKLSPEELNLAKELAQDIPLESIYLILKLEDEKPVQDEKERQELLERSPVLGVKGMEKLGIDSREFRQAIINNFPKGLLWNLQEIEYIDKEIPISREYGTKVGKIAAAHADFRSGKIVFSKGHQGTVIPWQIISTLRHEAGHFLDPEGNRMLTRQERLKLKKELVARIKSDKQFLSSYVQRIKNPDSDLKREIDDKSTEYLAEIVEHYLSGAYDSTFTAEDEKLLKELMGKMDPNFNHNKAEENISKIVAKWNDQYFRKTRDNTR